MAGRGIIKPNPVNLAGDQNKINYSTDDFRKLRVLNTCYVDKTKMIEELISDDEGKVILFTRPRRFGKSLNLSMLRYFFDWSEDSRELFRGLYIERSPVFEKYLNQYPVVYLNFKNANVETRANAQKTIGNIINNLLKDLAKIYGCNELLDLEFILNSGGVDAEQLKQMTKILREKTGKDVIVLVDEYDNLINKAYGKEDWHDICEIVKDIFGALFKSNEYLKFGMLTGVSRIGKELSFSDMNNLVVYGLTKRRYYEYFGFTEEEVKALLQRHGLELSDEFYEMYNGYHLDDSPNMFNPASILKFLDDYLATGKPHLNSYWVNAATNFILKDNIKKMDMDFRDELLNLIDGESVDEKLVNSIDYEALSRRENLFTLLIDTGYLCPTEQVAGDAYTLKIPNREVLYGYGDMLESIMGVNGERLAMLCKDLTEGRMERFEKRWNEVLLQVSSFHDFGEKENSYHNLLVGALLYLIDTWDVRSNRESGLGRYDIAVIPKEVYRKKYKPLIIEFKVVTAGGERPGNSGKETNQTIEEIVKKEQAEDLVGKLAELAEAAIEQIKEKKYYGEYTNLYGEKDFMLVGIGARGKESVVRWESN